MFKDPRTSGRGPVTLAAGTSLMAQATESASLLPLWQVPSSVSPFRAGLGLSVFLNSATESPSAAQEVKERVLALGSTGKQKLTP